MLVKIMICKRPVTESLIFPYRWTMLWISFNWSVKSVFSKNVTTLIHTWSDEALHTFSNIDHSEFNKRLRKSINEWALPVLFHLHFLHLFFVISKKINREKNETKQNKTKNTKKEKSRPLTIGILLLHGNNRSSGLSRFFVCFLFSVSYLFLKNQAHST